MALSSKCATCLLVLLEEFYEGFSYGWGKLVVNSCRIESDKTDKFFIYAVQAYVFSHDCYIFNSYQLPVISYEWAMGNVR
ncbi:MAG: hypothetical protein KME30_33170 [Iphinoe sp. HA4291-MV1]|nr:hypothetical protein [Iphinoe sp. HA4291-MV1]